ncbi:MAG: hypothetical protein IT379_40940 [Deltaproteobacteria bacterium]|nr:hypothetical protein [Deltaproteobacteria bacterium]
MTVADPEATLRAAERVVELLARQGLETVVIGAVALAAYKYVRETRDLDLGVDASLGQMRDVARALEREPGFTVALHEPDADDPLGGVIDVEGEFGRIQIVSFGDRFPAAIVDGIREATLVVREGSPLRIIPLPQLVALKAYAGGMKSLADIVEVLARNPDVDRDAILEVCRRYRLEARIEALLSEEL